MPSRILRGVPEAREEGVDALEQVGGVLAEFAGRREHIIGKRTRPFGGAACAAHIQRHARGAGGGNKSGAGRGVPDTNVSAKRGGKIGGPRGGKASANRPAAARSRSAKKAAATRKRQATKRSTARKKK